MKFVTTCTLDCPDACSLWVEKDPGGNLKIRGNPEHPFTAGFTCAKVRTFLPRLQSPHRITRPLLRKGTGWQPLSWDEALNLCAEKIQTYRKEPASILHIHGEGAKGIVKLVSEFFFAKLGASTIRGSLCDNAGIFACIEDFGSLESNDITDLLNARGIVNWGRDLSRSSIHVAAIVRQARRSGTQVLTISPGGDGNRTYSDSMIRIRPGTDRFLAAAIIRLFLERNQIKESVIERTTNWPVFRELIEQQSFEQLIQRCDVSLENMERLYSFYSQSGPVATLMGWGLQRYTFGGENVRFINALALLSGNVGRSGGGSTFNISSMRNFNLTWATPETHMPRRTLLLPAIGDEILGVNGPPIEMIWVNGHNVVNQAPNSRRIAQAFEQVPFKVVVDAFMTDTAQRADLLLPCALLFEREDIVGSFLHDYVNYAARIMEPPDEARSDFQIFWELGKQLDPPILVPELDECFRISLDSPYLDISLDELRERGFARAKRPKIPFTGMQFAHPDGKYRFPEILHPEPPPPSDYPLQLLTLIRKNVIHSQILPEDHEQHPTVHVSPENPLLSTLHMDRDVFLTSSLGRIRVKVETDPSLHPEMVIYRRGDWMKYGGGINQLIASQLTDMGEGTAFYSQYVRLEN
jgi:anaerobic selenocysteine-containing dehydrogenase